MSASTSSTIEASSGFLNRAPKGREVVHRLYQDQGHRERMQSAIKTVFSNPLGAFFLRAKQTETQIYNFTAHEWRKKTDDDGDAETDVNKAVRDFLVNRVETLATHFVGETKHDAELVQEFLLAKLGAGKFESTADFIEHGQTTVADAHQKLASSLTKIYENRFKSTEEKAEKNDGDHVPDAASLASSSSSPATLETPPDDERDSPNSSDERDDASQESASPQGSPQPSLNDNLKGLLRTATDVDEDEASSSNSAAALALDVMQVDGDDSDDDGVASPPAAASASSSSADESDDANSVESDDDTFGDYDDSTNAVKKKRSAFANFFARIGNGIEKFFVSIWTFIKKIFS